MIPAQALAIPQSPSPVPLARHRAAGSATAAPAPPAVAAASSGPTTTPAGAGAGAAATADRKLIRRADVEQHRHSCPAVVIACPLKALGCSATGPRGTMHRHLADDQRHMLLMLRHVTGVSRRLSETNRRLTDVQRQANDLVGRNAELVRELTSLDVQTGKVAHMAGGITRVCVSVGAIPCLLTRPVTKHTHPHVHREASGAHRVCAMAHWEWGTLSLV